jgi:cellulase/cellobiase CelA1
MPDEVTRLLADLVARRRQIVEMIAAEAHPSLTYTDQTLEALLPAITPCLKPTSRGCIDAEMARIEGVTFFVRIEIVQTLAKNTVVDTVAVGNVPFNVAVTRMGTTPMSRMQAPATFR